MAKRTKKAATQPTQIAAIDVGSTSIRLAVAELGPGGTLRHLDTLIHPAALGADSFRSGYITPASLRAVCQVLANFRQVLTEYQIQEFRAVATSSIREASNRDVAIDRIHHESGLTVEILDAVEENRLVFQSLQPILKQHQLTGRNYTLVLDLGGGSTETMLLRGNSLVLASSRRLGTSRLFHDIAGSDCGNAQPLLESVIRNAVTSTLDLYRSYAVTTCVVINSLLTRVLARTNAGNPDEGVEVPPERIGELVAQTAALSPEQLAERFDLGAAEAELFLPTLLILNSFVQNTTAKRVILARLELTDTILNDLSLRLSGRNPVQVFAEQVIGSARGIGEKYRYNAPHAQQVARLSLQLFDGLGGLFDFGPRDRLYLEVAAILHDIGMFISANSHHKHSAYLIIWAEIVGLTPPERNVVAQIARYHRKATPLPQHLEFSSLQPDERLRVTKLAALLRLADALDRGHNQQITTLDIRLDEEELVISAHAAGDLVVETTALKEKSRLFQEITGLKTTLRRAL